MSKLRLGWTQDKKDEREAVRPGDSWAWGSRDRSWVVSDGMADPATQEHLCAPLYFPDSLAVRRDHVKAQTNGIREEMTAVTSWPRWVSIHCGKPVSTSTLFLPVCGMFKARITFKFKDEESTREAT